MTDNPFDVTKAVDFSDSEIARTYVDFPGGSLPRLLSPSQALPIFLVGGKGGGRTHLLRRFSYPVRRDEGRGDLAGLAESGYLGIYFRCSGLNGARFSGKRQSDDTWSTAFAFFMDLWMVQLLLHTLTEIDSAATPRENQDSGHTWSREDVADFVSALSAVGEMRDILLQAIGSEDPLSTAADALAQELRMIDRKVNNAAISGDLDILIRAAPGEILFTAVEASRTSLPGLEDVKVTFLVDEFENLAAGQQKYVNTLIREKPRSCTFVVGSRQWGVRTLETLTNDEPNRRGSEFDQVVLEDQYREVRKDYLDFCHQLVSGRLAQAGFGSWTRSDLNHVLGGIGQGDTLLNLSLARDGLKDADRPHMDRLVKELEESFLASGSASDIVRALEVPENPIVEKWGLLQLYRHWASQGPPSLTRAHEIRRAAQAILDGTADERVLRSWNHWKADLIAQFYVDSGYPAPYFGFEQFVDLSGHLPRNLLVLLKNVTRWSQIAGQEPFASREPISSGAIERGIAEAARWFRMDSLPIGVLGQEIDRAINRLGQFLRAHRFSSKPVEVGCSGFSSDLQGVSTGAVRILTEAKLHSLLVGAERLDRNSGVPHGAFQLAPMLAPTFSLSSSRRGLLAVKAPELNAIFDPDVADAEFDSVLSARLRTLQAPFRRDDSAEAIF